MKISIITVCFNCEHEIKRTIESVLSQTYQEKEYIIIDGASKDGTIQVAKGLCGDRAIIASEPDKGIYDAMNKGIQKATGEWLCFMNAGDTFYDSFVLQDLAGCLTSEIGILRGNIIRKYPKFSVKSMGVTKQDPGLIDMFNNTFHHQACLIKKELFERYGYYSLDYKLCSDWKFFFDCVVLHHIKTKYVNKTVALFQMDGASSNNALKYKAEQEAYLKSLYGEELFGLLKELDVYRKSSLIRKFYQWKTGFIESLSPKNFNRLLTAKRVIKSFFGLNVN